MCEEEFMAKSQLTHSSALQFTQRAASWHLGTSSKLGTSWDKQQAGAGDKSQAGDKTAN